MPSSTKKKRVYYVVADRTLHIYGDAEYPAVYGTEVRAEWYMDILKKKFPNRKFNVMRITLSADTAKWKAE